MRIVIAECSVDYEGRLQAHLPLTKRLLMVKADGSVLVHSDGGSYKPLNWMSPPCAMAELAPDEDDAAAGVVAVVAPGVVVAVGTAEGSTVGSGGAKKAYHPSITRADSTMARIRLRLLSSMLGPRFYGQIRGALTGAPCKGQADCAPTDVGTGGQPPDPRDISTKKKELPAAPGWPRRPGSAA